MMPARALHPCATKGCPNLIPAGQAHCPAHTTQYEQDRGSAAVRGYDARWRRLRKMFLAANPLCADIYGDHARDGQVVAAIDVDHILPRAAGGQDDWDNLQALCPSCHSKKTAIEDGRWGQA